MLVGREVERDLVTAFVRGQTSEAVLVIRGEPGVGKTAVLDMAAEIAAAGAASQVMHLRYQWADGPPESIWR
ncbi:hypothetical protein [Nocardia sp. NPDC060259]|uniref:hypothetical protein n=1 Tax=Nocardia sp. NPDC060259 TaxID=3347088 RepID=UPI00364B9D5A